MEGSPGTLQPSFPAQLSAPGSTVPSAGSPPLATSNQQGASVAANSGGRRSSGRRAATQPRTRVVDSPSLSPPPGATGSVYDDDGHPSSAKVPAKRGRKKKADEVLSDDDDKERKRKLQNRAAQRNFRERKEQHVHTLEARVAEQDLELETLRAIIDRLTAENEALRRGEDVPPSGVAPKSPSPPPALTLRHAPTEKHIARGPQQPLIKPEELDGVVEPRLSSMFPEGAAFESLLKVNGSTSPTLPPPLPSTGATLPLVLPPAPDSTTGSLATFPAPNGVKTFNNGTTQLDAQLDVDMSNIELLDFDFDAPFAEFDASLPLPPLFQSLFGTPFLDEPTAPQDTSLNGAAYSHTHSPSSAINDDELGDDVCPGEGDDDEPPPLPNGRIPCDKPECDFSSISCALPIPWRPPSVAPNLPAKEVWVAQTAWAKLCSHPLFGQCDVNELCHELRDKTRCSDDGRLVISKSDVCDVFRTIPARARLWARQQEMVS